MTELYLGLGSNWGNRQELMTQALYMLEMRIGRIVCLSAFYETAPWGFESENCFLNAVVLIHTDLRPEEILWQTQEIERCLGREKKNKTRNLL